MGPRSVERGKNVPPPRSSGGRQASMGPRSVERGKNGRPGNRTAVVELQWGRVLLNAESERNAEGRDFYWCFNGAAFC